jgi:coenzyme F420-reducing hydrogenase delta subunit
LDPIHVINALKCGFEGVIGAVCSAEDCKLEKGRDAAERNLVVLNNALKKMNLLDNFEYYESSPRCEGEFKKKVDAFYTKLKAKKKCEVAVAEAT